MQEMALRKPQLQTYKQTTNKTLVLTLKKRQGNINIHNLLVRKNVYHSIFTRIIFLLSSMKF